MSIVTFPRRIDTRPPFRPAGPTPRRASHGAATSQRAAVRSKWRFTSVGGRSVATVVVALALSLVGTMVVASRQIEIHQLQSQLLQVQSTYAEQVGALTNVSAPSEIARQAGALHLVDPLSVTQVPSTSLDVPLSLPTFVGYAPVSSRTNR